MTYYFWRRSELLGSRKRKPKRNSKAVVARYLETVANLDRTRDMQSAFRRLEKAMG
jgi:hypothetical protein